MKIAALYDIHGNLPALEAVLAEVVSEGCGLIVVGGDVTPGPLSSECLEAIRSVGIPWIGLRGNGDNDVLAAARGQVPDRVPAGVRSLIEWAARDLSDDDLDELFRWAPTRRLEVAGLGAVLFCHATPRDDNEIFTERTPEARVATAFDGVDADLVVCGHTHMPFDRTVREIRIVNAGSVGLPFGDTQAQWLLLEPGGVTRRRTRYDLADAQRRIDEAGYPMPMPLAEPPGAERMLEAFEAVALR